jgi:hypothetical protein
MSRVSEFVDPAGAYARARPRFAERRGLENATAGNNEMQLTNEKKTHEHGFHAFWIVLPVLAVVLTALVLALPALYATRGHVAQRHLIVSSRRVGRAKSA